MVNIVRKARIRIRLKPFAMNSFLPDRERKT